MPISDINRIDARPWNRGLVILRAKKRTVFLRRRTPNLAAIVAEVAQQNPQATVVGRVPSAA
jgi:hypothetical protein